MKTFFSLYVEHTLHFYIFMLLSESKIYFISTNSLKTVPININFKVFIILYSILFF